MVARRDARGITKPAAPPHPLTRRDYPETDVHAMPGTPQHRDFMMLIFEIIRLFYKPIPTVYVASDMMVYYERDNPRRFVAPEWAFSETTAYPHDLPCLILFRMPGGAP